MRMHTQRDLLVWIIWMDKQLNDPDRTAYYLMQIAAEIRRANVKNPAKVKIEDMRLKFDLFKKRKKPTNFLQSISQSTSEIPEQASNEAESSTSDTRVTKEHLVQATAASKSMWLSAVGLTTSTKDTK